MFSSFICFSHLSFMWSIQVKFSGFVVFHLSEKELFRTGDRIIEIRLSEALRTNVFLLFTVHSSLAHHSDSSFFISFSIGLFFFHFHCSFMCFSDSILEISFVSLRSVEFKCFSAFGTLAGICPLEMKSCARLPTHSWTLIILSFPRGFCNIL